MAYVQFIISKAPIKKILRMQVLGTMSTWCKLHDVKFEVDIAGYELNYHFSNPVDLSFFCLNPPDLAVKFTIVS